MKHKNIFRKQFNYRYDNAVIVLIVINLAVFLVNSFYPLSKLYMSLIPAAVFQYFWLWQPFSYMFAHADFFHLFFNMFGLFIFGVPLERRLGTKEFILFYLLIGTLVGVASLFFYGAVAPKTPMLGASGAVYAVLFSYAVFFPNNMLYIWGILPVKAYVAVLGFIGIEVFSQVFNSNSGVAHMAHLAGILFAFFYFIVRYGYNPLNSFFQKRH